MLEEIIINRTRESNKSYSFQNDENPRVISEYWFQETPEGKTFFLVFYTQACRYSKCLGCNLPSKMSQHHIGYKDIMRQVDSVFHFILSKEDRKDIKKIIISNNGSILDEDTFSTTALIYLIAKINLMCPNVKIVSIETRPEYVDMEELEVISRALYERETPASLEIAIGFEAFNDKIRNEYFNKGLSLKSFESLAEKISSTNSRFQQKYPNEFVPMKLKTYFMLKPTSGLTDQEAVDDIIKGIDYLHKITFKYNIEINMHLNPTYVAKGTQLETDFNAGVYQPPNLMMTKKAAYHAHDKNISVFLGLYDEGLAVEGGSFVSQSDYDQKLVAVLNEFNITQNFKLLE